MLFFELLWWAQAIRHDYFSYFPDRYLLTITMVFGASVAGMTSEGGGAVAFPVMTAELGMISGSLLAGGFIVFFLMSRAGQRLLQQYQLDSPNHSPADVDKMGSIGAV